MKKIISLLLVLVLCMGLFAALGVSAYAIDVETKTVNFPQPFTQTSLEDVTISGYHTYSWWLCNREQYYSFTVEVPDNCQLKTVSFKLGYYNRWPSVSGGNVTKEGSDKMTVSFAPEDCVHSVTLYGVETANGKPVSAADNYWQCVETLTVKYSTPHTHEKDANAYHGAVAPTCCAGNVEYWGCTNPGCDAKLDASGNVIKDVTLPATEEHSPGDYIVTEPATCSATGIEATKCANCGETMTREIPIDPNAHSFGDYTVDKPATCEDAGVEIAVCSGCGATMTREIPATGVHTYSTEWSYNAKGHWHAATCGCDTKADYAAHSWKNYGSWLRPSYKCSVCDAPQNSSTASTLSEGNIWIVAGIAVVAAGTVAALVITKKKKSAAAETEEE